MMICEISTVFTKRLETVKLASFPVKNSNFRHFLFFLIVRSFLYFLCKVREKLLKLYRQGFTLATNLIQYDDICEIINIITKRLETVKLVFP